uniref:Uncharacterized protein n=1 Tax=Amphimedon queenslandica TaxID=400682 RepID=A0A1X7VBK7_AMPQE
FFIAIHSFYFNNLTWWHSMFYWQWW